MPYLCVGFESKKRNPPKRINSIQIILPNCESNIYGLMDQHSARKSEGTRRKVKIVQQSHCRSCKGRLTLYNQNREREKIINLKKMYKSLYQFYLAPSSPLKSFNFWLMNREPPAIKNVWGRCLYFSLDEKASPTSICIVSAGSISLLYISCIRTRPYIYRIRTRSISVSDYRHRNTHSISSIYVGKNINPTNDYNILPYANSCTNFTFMHSTSPLSRDFIVICENDRIYFNNMMYSLFRILCTKYPFSFRSKYDLFSTWLPPYVHTGTYTLVPIYAPEWREVVEVKGTTKIWSRASKSKGTQKSVSFYIKGIIPAASGRCWGTKVGLIVIKFNRTFSGDQTTKSIHFLLTDSDSDEFEMAVARYKPDRIESLCRTTKFNKKELQLMYRGFKQIEFDIDDMVIKFQECPAGLVDEETFKGIYAQFFPQGDSNQYAHYIFRSFDHNKTGTINFEEFVAGLSILTRGHLQEKLKWAFNLYDLDGDGCITKDEMYSVISSVYELMGDVTQPVYEADELSEHVDRVFQKLDANKDGILTIEEFVDSLSKVYLLNYLNFKFKDHEYPFGLSLFSYLQ
ncbi:Kv channel-interacting protein 4 [Nymphon striatum]|nr:Kv channel-interacting protein 4 [Nymphon striatum]